MCFSSTPVPPTAARIFVLSNLDSVIWYCSDRFPLVKHQYSWVPGGTRWVPRWDTVGVPLGHGVCPTGVRRVPHWDTACAPLGHGVCPTGTRCVSHWGTVGVPLGYGACPTGALWVSHWGTVGVPLGYGGCPAGVRWVSHRGPRSALETSGIDDKLQACNGGGSGPGTDKSVCATFGPARLHSPATTEGQSGLRPNTGPHPPIRPHPIPPLLRLLGEHDRGQRESFPL